MPNVVQQDPRDEGYADAEGTSVVDSLVQLLQILRRRWRVVLTALILSVGVGVGALSLLQPYWVATASIVVSAVGPQVLDTVKNVNEDGQWDPSGHKDYIGTQKEILRSRRIASAALARVGLAKDPEFLGVDLIRDPAEREARIAEIDPVERLREMLTITEVRDAQVLRVSVEYPDPIVARDIANAMTEAYIEFVGESRMTTGDQAAQDLGRERGDAEAELLAADQALDAFKQEHEITTISPSDSQNIIAQSISTLTIRTKAAQADRIEVDALYEQVKRLHDDGSLAGVSMLPMTERPVFDQLIKDRMEAERALAQAKGRYLEKHPEYVEAKHELEIIDERIKSTAKDLLNALEARRRAARATETRLESVLEAEQARALALGRLEPRYRQLEREANRAAETYALISKRDTEVGMTNRVEADDPVQVLDYATAPERPTRPRRAMLLGLSLLCGMALGTGLAVAIDFRDKRLRGVHDLKRAVASFGLPVLGHLPLLPPDPTLGVGNIRGQRRRRDLYTSLYPQSPMAERCRGVRTAINFSLPPDQHSVLLVTSAGSGEGKSSTAMNLAMSFCQAGRRVALLDADMRRPRLHQVFSNDIDKAQRGLSGVLTDEYTLDEALQTNLEDCPPTLSVLTCGEIPENPAELLGTAKALRLIAELRQRFEVVLIDSPPVLPVSDPLILAPQVDGVVLVARCESTTLTQIQDALSLMRQGDTNMLGVVLNGVESGRGGDHGYGYDSEYHAYGWRKVTADAS